jgi:HAD superfamily hydrolase (TIGR01509 family)
MIKAIIFDFGNVIYSFDNTIFIENISKITGKDEPELHDMIYAVSDVTRRYETGLISSEEFFTEVSGTCGLLISQEDFLQAFTGIFTPNNAMLELIKNVSGRYKTGLLSNTNEWHFEHIIKPCEVYGLFDAESLSFEVNAMKPSAKIFQDALRKLNAKAEESVYIDDIVQYVEKAHSLGFHGIHYTSHNDLISSLERLNICL